MFDDTISLKEARDRLFDLLAEGETVECDCCFQTARVYSRLLDSRMAAGLIAIYRHPAEWVHIPTLANEMELGNQLGGVLAKLRYWGLLEEEKARREDGGRAGYWRITDKGRAFVERRIKVEKYAKIYNNEVLGRTGKDISIDDALGQRFRYDELMSR
jgi:hypothetical protein